MSQMLSQNDGETRSKNAIMTNKHKLTSDTGVSHYERD